MEFDDLPDSKSKGSKVMMSEEHKEKNILFFLKKRFSFRIILSLGFWTLLLVLWILLLLNKLPGSILEGMIVLSVFTILLLLVLFNFGKGGVTQVKRT